MLPASPRPWWRRWTSPLIKLFKREKSAALAAQADDRTLVFSLSRSRIPNARQLGYLPRTLSTRERNWIRIFFTLAILSLMTLGGHTVMRHVTRVAADGGSFTEGMIGTPQFLNPVLARPYTIDAELNRLLFRGLLRIDDRLQVVPDLAEYVQVSDDGKVYTVTLRPNLRWSDGEPLNAADVIYTFETVADPTYQSPQQSLFKNVQVAMTDDRTVTFTLPQAFEPFRSYLTLGLIPAHLWQDQTPQNFPLAEANIKPVTNGPYKFQSVTKDRTGNIKSYTFIRNKETLGDRPPIEKITTKFYPEVTSAIDALKSNAIDSLGGIETKDLDQVKKFRSIMHYTVAQLTGVFFNQKNSAVLKNKEVRRALAMAVDRQGLITTTMNGIGRPAFSPIVPGQPGYDTAAKHLDFDPTKAQATLEQTGWKAGADGIRRKGKSTLAFTLTTVDDQRYTPLANALASAWTALGVKVEVKTIPVERIQKDIIRPRQYDALLFGQIFDTDGDPYLLWHSSQQLSTGIALAVGYDKTIDQSLDAARSATNAQKHQSALLDFQNAVGDVVPGIIIAQSEYLCAHHPSLRGLVDSQLVTPADRFGSVAAWYLKTAWRWK